MPNTSLHRLVQALYWVTSSDWTDFDTDPTLSVELNQRTAGWLSVLMDYLHAIPRHVRELEMLVRTKSADTQHGR